MVIKQSSVGHQTAVRWSSDSHQTVIRQSSHSHHTVITQSLHSHHTVITQSLHFHKSLIVIFDIDIFEILRLTAFSVLFLFHLQPHICYNINPWRRPRQPCQLPNRVNIIRSNKSVALNDQRLQIHLVHSPIHQLQQDPRLPPTLRQVVRVFLHIIKPILSIQRKVF